MFAIAIIPLYISGKGFADAPPLTDYCERLQQPIQGKKHGFLAGNVTHYVGGFHASWDLIEHETLGLTHPFHHDLRSRGVGRLPSLGKDHDNTGVGNDFSGWEFYKDTRVLYGTVVVDEKLYQNPVPVKMDWRPDRMICEYEVGGVRLKEEKFIAANDAAGSIITSSRPVTLKFDGQSFYGRNSLTSTATAEYDADFNAIHIVEGGTTKCQPETDRRERVGPIMYQGMSTVLAASRDFGLSHRFTQGEHGQVEYEFEVPCDRKGVTIAWAMHDDGDTALNHASEVVREPKDSMIAKTREMNRQLNAEVPWFRCSDRKFEDIYYFLWSLYLMYTIDVQSGWETVPHTQTAVNNFLGMHRYDASFQIKVGAWMGDKPQYAYGNVLTWKPLFQNGHYRKLPGGEIALADNKGTTWHSGVYGNELSEHVLGAWQIYEHTGDVEFLRDCYEGYFREIFYEQIAPFFSNHFEVAQVLIEMAQVTGHVEDIEHWKQIVPRNPDQIRTWFEQRWQANGHQSFFGGPKDGMLMTTGFWHMRSKHFPRDYALSMTRSWATDEDKGFYGGQSRPFPLAMSRQSMQQFTTDVDHSFGYTPDTAYFTLDGMFRQRLGDPAWRLTLNHLSNYNFSSDWNLPVAPEAYTRSGQLFGDQYSNFNAGKLLLYLEGLAGLEYSIPDRSLTVHDTMPKDWKWMEVRLPMRMPGEQELHWPTIRYERSQDGDETVKSISVRDSPLRIAIEPWAEGSRVIATDKQPADFLELKPTGFPSYQTFLFDERRSAASVTIRLGPDIQEDGR